MMDDIDHAERAHSELGASAAYRWMACPGSVRLSRGMPNLSSDASREGTAAHELAEACLRNGQAAIEYTGRGFNGFEVTAEMAEGVQMYVDYVRGIQADTLSDARGIEFRGTLDDLMPPAPMFGTIDAWAYVTGSRTVHIADLKYGARGRVEAVGNTQLRIYAMMTVLMLRDHPTLRGSPPKTVRMAIVQPRQPAAGSDPIRVAEISVDELMAWVPELLAKAEAAMAPDAPAVPGSWCQFCPAAGVCKAQAAQALTAVQSTFGDLDAEVRLVEPGTYSPAELRRAMEAAPALLRWLVALQKAVWAQAAEGVEEVGFKIIEAQARDAKWIDEAAAETELSLVYGVAPYSTPALVSPAQARARLTAALAPNHKTKKAAEAEAREILARLSTRPTRQKLVPLTDARPAVIGCGNVFAGLSDETDNEV